MPRRGGKAASRRARQKKAQRGPAPQQRAPSRTAPPAPAEAEGGAPAPGSQSGPSGQSGQSAFEAADAEVRATTATPGASFGGSRSQRDVRARVSDFNLGASGPSRLSERAVSEYHYVVRDLRNIAVLLVLMTVLLAAAVVAVNLLGIARA